MQFVLPCSEYKNMPSPFDNSPDFPQYKRRCGYVPICKIPVELGDYNIADEEQEINEELVREWFTYKQSQFHFLADIVVHAPKVIYDNRVKKVSFTVDKTSGINGIILGGELLSEALRLREEIPIMTPNGEIYLSFEFLSGFDRDQLDKLVEMRRISC